DDVKRVEQKLDQRAELRFALTAAPGLLPGAAVPVLRLTSEAEFPVEFRLQPDRSPDLPPGVPVVWVEPGEALQAALPGGSQRLTRPVGDRPDTLAACPPGRPDLRPATARPAAP